MTRSSSLAALAAGLVSLLSLLPAGLSAAPLRGSNVVSAPGSEGDARGRFVGDFNGDGIDDYVAALGVTQDSTRLTATVVFGSRSTDNLTLARDPSSGDVLPVGSRGMQITAALPASLAYHAFNEVTGAGDVDGDGYDDVIVGYNTGSSTKTLQIHRAYIVYGAPGTASVALTTGPRVTALQLTQAGSETQHDSRVDGIGDFDGDGFDDVAYTRSSGSLTGGTEISGAGIFRGGPRVALVDTTRQSARTSLITGSRSCIFDIFHLRNFCLAYQPTLTALGDFDGDGKADVFMDNGRDDGRTILLGRVGTFTINAQSPGKNSIRFAAQTAARAWRADVVHSVGDVNGDGLADFAFRPPTSATPPFSIGIITGRTSAASPISSTTATILRSGTQNLLAAGPAPDQNGDGKGDVAVITQSLAAPWQRTLKIVTGIGSAASVDVDALPAVAGLPTATVYDSADWTLEGGSDIDGDGQSDVLYSDQQLGGLWLVTAGPDEAPPQAFGPADPADRGHAEGSGVWLDPYDFNTDDGSTLNIGLRETALVDVVYRRADGSVIATQTRALPAGVTATHWDGRLNGTLLPTGDYSVEVTPRDAAGNRGATVPFPFSVVNPGGESGAPAGVTFGAQAFGVDGKPVHPNVPIQVTCPNSYRLDLQPGGGYEVPPTLQAGDNCSVHVLSFAEQGALDLNCDDDQTIAVNGGAAQPRSDASFRLAPGTNTVDIVVHCRDAAAPAGPVQPIGATGWVNRGDAVHPNPGEAWLAYAANATGSVVWNAPIEPNGKTFTFTALMNGGNGQAEGMTMALLPAAQTSPATGFLGAGGGGLGFGGLPGVAFALDMFKGPGDPGANYVGIAQGGSATGLNWLQSADAGVRLRGTAVKITIASKNGVVTVAVNGSVRLTRTMTLPSPAYLAFTASTSAQWQAHYVYGLTVS